MVGDEFARKVGVHAPVSENLRLDCSHLRSGFPFVQGCGLGLYKYNFHDVFSVVANCGYFEGMFHAFRRNGERKFRIQFLMDDELKVSPFGKPSVNMMFYHNSEENATEFSYPWLAQICAKLVVAEDYSEYKFYFNRNYLRFSNIVAEGWELVDVLRSTLLVSLIRNGMYMVHGAAVRIEQEGILIPSFGNTGKTTTAWMLAKRGADFLTDEFAIIDADRRCYGFPCSSLVSSDLVKAIGLKLTVWQSASLRFNQVKSKLLSTRFAPGGIKAYPDQFFKTHDKADIDKIVFIQNGVDSVRRIAVDEALTRLRAIQAYELNWRSNPYLIAESFFDSKFDLEDLSSKEDEILRTLVSKVKKYYVVSSSRAAHFKAIEEICHDHE